MRDDPERLADILRAVDRIVSKTTHGRTVFDGDEMLQVWVLYHLQIVGGGGSLSIRRVPPIAS